MSWREELECALRALATLLRDEKTISWYEVHVIRLVPVLLHCLTGTTRGGDPGTPRSGEGEGGGVSSREEKANERVKLFKMVFVEALDDHPSDLDARYVWRDTEAGTDRSA